MTDSAAVLFAPANNALAVESKSFAARYRILCALLVLAAAIRLPLAFWPNINHNDEIYQYLEPAWRLLGHQGVVTWEWHDGIRSWFLPVLFAGPVALGDWLAPGGWGAFVVPRLVVSLASLSIVVAAWHFGGRISRACHRRGPCRRSLVRARLFRASHPQ